MSSEHGGTPDRTPDTEAALQRELKREKAEGSGTVGDMETERNLSGASTWVTLPLADAAPSADRASAPEPGDDFRRAVREELSDRLRRRGVSVSERDTDEQLVDLLEAVERFEAAVQVRGGDLMMDEPIGNAQPVQPDNRAFVLPKRHPGESIGSFLERIAQARDRVSH
jgi:hypothetical protein